LAHSTTNGSIQWHRDHPEGQDGVKEAVKILSGR
jgi:hypothetical protein